MAEWSIARRCVVGLMGILFLSLYLLIPDAKLIPESRFRWEYGVGLAACVLLLVFAIAAWRRMRKRFRAEFLALLETAPASTFEHWTVAPDVWRAFLAYEFRHRNLWAASFVFVSSVLLVGLPALTMKRSIDPVMAVLCMVAFTLAGCAVVLLYNRRMRQRWQKPGIGEVWVGKDGFRLNEKVVNLRSEGGRPHAEMQWLPQPGFGVLKITVYPGTQGSRTHRLPVPPEARDAGKRAVVALLQ